MRTHTHLEKIARSEYDKQLTKMSFDESRGSLSGSVPGIIFLILRINTSSYMYTSVCYEYRTNAVNGYLHAHMRILDRA